MTLLATGNSARIDTRFVAEVAIWLRFYLIVLARALWFRAVRARGPAILFVPDLPQPWYMVRIAALWAGFRIARTAATADLAFYFEDVTTSVPPPPPSALHYNFGCGDIAKSRVAALFAEAAGYPLAIDPARFDGPAVEKGEANGAHDGRIVHCPLIARAGRVYQRLIDTIGDDGIHREYRTHVVGGRVVAVWEKRRAAAERFLPPNLSARRIAIDAVFSVDERALIARFTVAMGLDWAGLDVLRDRADGRIYIIDANKTDAGPIIALPLAEKLEAVATLARALTALTAG